MRGAQRRGNPHGNADRSLQAFARHDDRRRREIFGIARGELDPADPRNKVIVDIDRARNAAGMVEYETDLFILRPADPTKGNRQLLFDVVNRGNKVVTNRLNRTTPKDDSNDPATLAQAGDGFLFRRGYNDRLGGLGSRLAEGERRHDDPHPGAARRRARDPRRVRLGHARAAGGAVPAELRRGTAGSGGCASDQTCACRRSADRGARRAMALHRYAQRSRCCPRARCRRQV